jgi:hypothetical protein
MAKNDLNALEGKHGKALQKRAMQKRAAPAPKISTESKGMDSPIDMIGAVNKGWTPPSLPPSVTGQYTGRVSTDSGPRGTIGGRGTDTNWSRPETGAGTHRTSTVSIQNTGGKGARKMAKAATKEKLCDCGKPVSQCTCAGHNHKSVTKGIRDRKEELGVLQAYRESRRGGPIVNPAYKQYAKAQTDTTAMPKNIMSPTNQKTGAQVLRAKAGLKKDITSGFVPSIGVKQGKKRDLQDPATNLYPPAGTKK